MAYFGSHCDLPWFFLLNFNDASRSFSGDLRSWLRDGAISKGTFSLTTLVLHKRASDVP